MINSKCKFSTHCYVTLFYIFNYKIQHYPNFDNKKHSFAFYSDAKGLL
ncbi:hypothetical protein PAND9192_00597 [Photobacterium andalusiense]|uniref:Uncharacterized protein n=1 Tax=Photobacterium andalusiense TaxID=2204296 RepID=A0A1Y6M8B8_9GAMM|nr:hypothetical protein PAND9192_00597 [Photobacterium andalusiense]